MKKVIIFGIGDIAQIAHFYFTHDSDYSIAAFTVDSAYMDKTHFCGLPIIPFENLENLYSSSEYAVFIAISYAGLNSVRAQKYKEAKAKGYEIVSYVSTKATIWPGFEVGENCFILEDNTIQPFATIGNNVTLWSGNHIGHHSKIHDNCFISSHVVISGGVTIGKNCFIGVNATLRDHICIGDDCIIAAGSLVVKDAIDDGVYVGQPAKLIKKASEVDKI